MVPWTEWAYCTCGDPTGSPIEGIVNDPRKPKTGSNLVTGTLDALVEPYPHVIAGTPSVVGLQPPDEDVQADLHGRGGRPGRARSPPAR